MCISSLSLSLVLLCVCSFLVNRLSSKRKEEKEDDEFQMFVYSFAVLDFSSLCLCPGDLSVLPLSIDKTEQIQLILSTCRQETDERVFFLQGGSHGHRDRSKCRMAGNSILPLLGGSKTLCLKLSDYSIARQAY